MNRPTPKQLSAWYEAQDQGERTCTDCGKIGPAWRVQPQHPYYAEGREGVSRCTDCITAINVRMRDERKAQLATMPRCEVDGCRQRATYTVAGSVGMCGRHLRAARIKAQSFGWLAMTIGHDRETILGLAKEAR